MQQVLFCWLAFDVDFGYFVLQLSSVARGGGGAGGARASPIGLWSMQNRMFFVLLRPIFWEKWKIGPPIRKQPPLKRLNLRSWTKNQSRYRWRPFFWRPPKFGREKPLNFGFRPKNHFQFWWRPFFFFFFLEITWFWAEKNLRISDFGRKITLNFGEDLFFFFYFWDHLILGGKKLWISELSEKFRLNFRTNRLKLLLDQWKFQSRSFAHFSLFQNSPPFFPNPGYAPATAADLILSRTQDEFHYFFVTIIFHENPRLIVAQNLKKSQPPSVTKRLETKRINFKSWKQLNSVLIQNDEILVIFQYLQAKYCNNSKITECCFKLRKQVINIWMFSSQKKSVFFRFCSFTMLLNQQKSLCSSWQSIRNWTPK